MSEEKLSISEEVSQQLTAYRQRANALRMEIGNLEITKYRLFGELGQIESVAQGLLQEEASRLGIPDGEAWTVAPDGTVTRGEQQAG